jgi:hypothetical protein
MNPARAMTARLGVLAVLFQAILFGWHHHDLTFPGRLSMPVIENHSATPQIADDEDGCEICQVFHHLTAAPVEFPAIEPPRAVIAGSVDRDPAMVRGTAAVAFQARAPPSPAAAIG